MSTVVHLVVETVSAFGGGDLTWTGLVGFVVGVAGILCRAAPEAWWHR